MEIKAGETYYHKDTKHIRLRVDKVEKNVIHFTYLHFNWSGSLLLTGFINSYIKEIPTSLFDFM